jgi:hypothetical protein
VLSEIVIRDDLHEADGWRFLGRSLRFAQPEDQAILSTHKLLRDAAVSVFDQIRDGGFAPSERAHSRT